MAAPRSSLKNGTVMKRTFGRMAAALLLAGCLALLQGCDATTGGVRSQSPGPFPYNSPHG